MPLLRKESNPKAQDYFQKHQKSESIHLLGPLCSAQPPYNEPVLFVDRGVLWRRGTEGLSVGDGDSTFEPLDIRWPADKNYSDLAGALALIPASFRQIHLWGFLGGRRDHELMNFAEAHSFLLNKKETQIFFENRVIALSAGRWTLSITGLFSLFSFENSSARISGKSLYTTGTGDTLKPLSSHGLSNMGKGEVQIEGSTPLFLFLNP